MSTTLVRRSARLAKSCSVLGSVYVWMSSSKQKVKKPKAQLRPRPTPPPRENPVKFCLDGMKPMFEEYEWMDERMVDDPIEGERYDIVTVDIYFEEHDGNCDHPEAWFTEPEMTHTIYLQCIGEMPLQALYRPWSEENDRHNGCDAKIHYVVRKVELNTPFVWKNTTSSCFCKACGAGVDFMEFCPCQEEIEDDYLDVCPYDSDDDF